MASSASQPFLGLSHNAHPYAPWGGALRDDPKNGQKRFPFNKYSGLKFFGNSTSPFRSHRSVPSHRAFGYWYCKQDTKERYWGQQFVKWKGTFEITWPFKVDHLQTGPEYSVWCTNRSFRNFGLKGKRPKLQHGPVRRKSAYWPRHQLASSIKRAPYSDGQTSIV